MLQPNKYNQENKKGTPSKRMGACIQKGWTMHSKMRGGGGWRSGETRQQPPKKRSVTTASGCPPCVRLGVQAPVFKVRTLRK